MSERVTIDITDSVATVTLNRADKNNALDIAMFEAIIQAGKSLKADPSIRAVVLRGAGQHFCAGLDLSVFRDASDGIGEVARGRMQPLEGSVANFFQSSAYVWRELPIPVIAALRGVAYGGGLQIALGADIRYAASDLQVSIMEINWGIIPDMAISVTAKNIVAIDKLKELAFTGRILHADDALDAGLVTAIHDDPMEAALSIAQEIAGRSPEAVRAIKTLFNHSLQDSFARSLSREAELQLAVMSGKNQREAVVSKLEKRTAIFSDPE